MAIYITDCDCAFTSMLIEVDMMATISDVIKELPSRRYGWDIYYQDEKCSIGDLLPDLGICPETTLMVKSGPSYVFHTKEELRKAIENYDCSNKYGDCNRWDVSRWVY